MKIIVPLAGPDFVRKNGSTKAEINHLGEDLLHYILKRRPWFGIALSCDYIFILEDKNATRKLAKEKIKIWFPGCKIIFLSDTTGGAAYSSACSSAYFCDPNESLIIDLADIDYELDSSIVSKITALGEGDAIALTFSSTNPIYSYLLFDRNGEFIESKEKQVISSIASAGTYIFGSGLSFIKAFENALRNKSKYLHDGMMYLCPLFNGVKANAGTVKKVDVANVFDLKLGEQNGP